MNKRLALVVGAGAVKCAAALGLWHELQEAGIHVDRFIGCSGGSLYTSLMGTCASLQEATEKTLNLWTRQVTSKRNTRAMLSALLPGALKFNERFSMMDDGVLNERLRTTFGASTFAETCAPLQIVATDLMSGEMVVLEQGSLFDAIRASIAIPYIWPAWQVNGRWLVDGSYADPLPVDVAIKDGAEIILAMGFESPYPRRIKSLSRYAFQLNSVMTNNLFRANFAFHNLAHHAEILPILPEFGEEVGLFDTQKIPLVIEKGAQAMQAQMAYLKQLLEIG